MPEKFTLAERPDPAAKLRHGQFDSRASMTEIEPSSKPSPLRDETSLGSPDVDRHTVDNEPVPAKYLDMEDKYSEKVEHIEVPRNIAI